jgi:transposase
MRMSYPLKFREHVFKIKEEEKLSYAKISERFKIALRTVMRWARRIEPKMTRDKPAVKIKMDALEEDIKKYPDATQRERASRLRVSQHCIYKALRRLKVTYKKNPSNTRKLTLLPEKPLRKK